MSAHQTVLVWEDLSDRELHKFHFHPSFRLPTELNLELCTS